MKIQQFKLFLLLLFLASSGGLAQDGSDQDVHPFRGRAPVQGPPREISIECHTLFAPDSGKFRYDIFYSVRKEYFVTTAADPSRPADYLGDASFEVLDAKKMSLGFQHQKITMNPADGGSANQRTQGRVIFYLNPGTYTLITEITDKGSSRRYFDTTRHFHIESMERHPRRNSDVIAVHPLNDSGSSSPIVPWNLGGDIPFGLSSDAVVEIAGRQSIDFKPFLLLHPARRLDEHRREGENPLKEDTLRPYRILPGLLAPAEGITDTISTAPGGNVVTAFFHLPADTLGEGRYEITPGPDGTDSGAFPRHHFNITWFNRPRSLSSIPLAVEALRYIATEAQCDSIREADPEEQRLLLYKYWKPRDPTPGTVYNEAMAEFYARVDYATTAFSTIKQQAGYKTDRGKTYILMGQPSSIDRILSPNGSPEEIWTYSSLRKRISFTDNSKIGEYKLMDTEDIR
jgi:GWxTD domain-containing protein